MELTTSPIFSIMVTTVAMLALLGNWLLWRQLVSLQRNFGQDSARLFKEMHANIQTNLGMGRKLRSFEQRIISLASEPTAPVKKSAPPMLEPAPQLIPAEADNMPANNSYSNASLLFKQGCSIDEVARRCGLARAEAELMALVHQKAS